MAIDRSTEDFRRTEAIQMDVSDPGASAWVSANAGSGKTHVLTNRVIRLLMGKPEDGDTGVSPSSILCITYTKAAAAEMQSRIFRILGEWALIDDHSLAAALKERLGPGVELPPLSRVRRLFAQALDTPGGLRIQTIHAFCERLLGRFPVEAGLLPGFSVLDDAGTAEIRQRIAGDLAREAPDTALAAALGHLLDHFGSIDAVMSAVTAREFEQGQDEQTIASRLGIDLGTDTKAIKKSALDRLDRRWLRSLEVLHPEFLAEFGESKRQKYALQSAAAIRILSATGDGVDDVFGEACAAWLTSTGAKPSDRTLKGNPFVRERLDSYAVDSSAVCDILCEALDQVSGAEIFELTKSILTVAAEVRTRYEAAKAARGAVDFADLITRTASLLENVEEAWIRYKLDEGISHLLLDEAQDTGAEQWRVVNQFRDAFWKKGATGNAPRTAFVVGDKKQSIYSFQGADADLFDLEHERMSRAAASTNQRFRSESLFLSFRSARSVLRAVDEFFAGEAGSGLHTDEPEQHAPAKPSLSGRVELWPLVEKPPKENPDHWSLPVDQVRPDHPYTVLARMIARDIDDFVKTGVIDKGDGSGRRPRYGDIMILCQRRTGIFPEIVRRLSLAGIPNGGTDRVTLLGDVAVQDIQSALRFAVNHDDDLSLAEFLKSPLGRFSDDDLYALAQPRQKKRLWAALRQAQGDDAFGRLCRQAAERLDHAEKRGRQAGAFAFVSALLDEGEPTGRYLFRQRLGHGSDDAIDELLSEALNFDLENPRTLDGFLAHIESLTSDIKKEFATDSDVVRIMTVHGAKGLEAPVVYLADAAYLPRPRYDALPLLNQGKKDGIAVRVPSGVTHPAVTAGKDFLKVRELQEYRRKFYVAATRAEQRLVICGTESGSRSKAGPPEALVAAKPAAETSWYGLALQAFERLSDEVTTSACLWREDTGISVFGTAPPPLGTPAAAKDHEAPPAAPDWLFAPAASESIDLVNFPSSDDDHDDGPVISPLGEGAAAGLARRRGVVIHELLEMLPARDPRLWAADADVWLARTAPDVAEADRAAWRDETLAVLREQAFSAVFGSDARAEVPLFGEVDGRTYAGQVDRLLVTADRILVVDYKTMRPPPADPALTPPGILRQMAIYRELLRCSFPGREVEAAILWTYAPALMALPAELLDKALRPAR